MQDTNFKEDSLIHLFYWEKENRKVFDKIKKLIIEISRTPYTGTGHPEPLTGNLSGKWSRHITDKDRLIYSVDGDTVNIYSCKDHYGDK